MKNYLTTLEKSTKIYVASTTILFIAIIQILLAPFYLPNPWLLVAVAAIAIMVHYLYITLKLYLAVWHDENFANRIAISGTSILVLSFLIMAIFML